MQKARTVAQVIAGEAVVGTPAERYADMLGIASVIENRARQMGVSPEDVVSVQRQFNAFNKAMPKGTMSLLGMADAAIAHVKEKGPIHKGTFYATPAATRNLPKGLSPIAETTGHRYFTDPKNRPVETAVGFRTPSIAPSLPATGPKPTPARDDYRQIADARSRMPTTAARTPSPVANAFTAPTRPTNAMAAINGMLSAPQAAPRSPVASAYSAPQTANRIASAPVRASVAPARQAAPVSAPVRTASAVPTTATLQGRDVTPPSFSAAPSFAGFQAPTKSPMAEQGRRVAPSDALSAAQAANLASRLDVSAPRVASAVPSTAQRLSAVANVTPQAKPGMFGSALSTIGQAIGPNVAQAATLSAPARAAVPNAPTIASRVSPATTLSPVQTARALSPVSTATAASVANVAQPARVASVNTLPDGLTADAKARAITSITTPTRPAYNQTPAFSAAKPKIDAIGQPPIPGLQRAPVTAPKVASPVVAAPALAAPKTIATRQVAAVQPVARQPVTARPAPAVTPARVAPAAQARAAGLGLPSVPNAPAQPSTLGRIGGFLSNNAPRALGSVIGSAVLGPVGGLLGGYLGNRMSNGPAMSSQAQAAMNAGTFDGFSHGPAMSRPGVSTGGLGGLGGMSSRGSSGSNSSNGSRSSASTGVGGNGSNFGGSSFGGGRNATGGNNNTSSKSSSSSKSSGSSSKSGGGKKK